MSLFSSIQLANNALIAAQVGLQVTGNNIANANTPGYVREVVRLTPAPTQRVGDLVLGLGVKVDAVVQQIDLFLEDRLRHATSDLANGEVQEGTYLQLESLIGELSDTDLSTSLNRFFSSIHDILNQPESIPVRNLAVLEGKNLTEDIRRLNNRVRTIHDDLNERVYEAADNINRLVEEVAELNVKIVTVEGGDTSHSEAGALRDQRRQALAELSRIIDIRVFEQPSGAVSVLAGGDFLVFDATTRQVAAVLIEEDGFNAVEVRVVDTAAPLPSSSGELAGLYESRDQILGGFLDRLDAFARTLAFEFNKAFSGGQGLAGYTQLTGHSGAADSEAPLDQAGLPYTPANGSFQVQVKNTQTGLTETTDILVELNGSDEDTTLSDLVAAIDAIDGISALITPQRHLRITSDSSNVEFAFAEDTSGALAALGLNTFFTGSAAGNLDVSSTLLERPGMFAASGSGIGVDTRNAVALASFLDTPLASRGGESLSIMYDRLAEETTQAVAVSRAVAEGLRVFHRTLEGQHLGVSGVSMDEEAVNMIAYQRMYQAAARYIATLDELLEMLVNL